MAETLVLSLVFVALIRACIFAIKRRASRGPRGTTGTTPLFPYGPPWAKVPSERDERAARYSRRRAR